MIENGLLIAIEGIDGSGKSTLVKFIKEELQKLKKEVLVISTREPKKEFLFNLIVKNYNLDPFSPSHMFFFQMLHAYKTEEALKALQQGKIVIADRWDFSFFVYHENFGFLSKESKKLREDLSKLAFNEIKPDLGIYLDVSINKAIDRRMWRGETIIDIKKEKLFYEKVIKSYQILSKNNNWKIVDANAEFEEVKELTWKLIEKIIYKKISSGD